MKNKLLCELFKISLFLIPFFGKAQLAPGTPAYDYPVFYGGPLGLNNPPVAGDDFANMCQQGGTITIPVQDNDTDPDGDLMATMVIWGPTNGTANVIGTNVTYTPDFGFYGIDIINYVICDGGIPSMCDTGTITVTVTQAPVADCGPDQTICFGSTTTVGTPAIAGNTYSWSPAAGLSATNIAQPFCSPTVTSTTYTLNVYSTVTGCSNSDMVTITVNPIPPANAGPDHTICQNDSVQLGTPGIFGNTYYWTPIAPLNNNSIPQPMAAPDTTTTFLLVVTTTATGCYNTDSAIVNITPAPPTNAGPNKTVCIGQSVTIGTPAVPGNTYSWFPALGLSSTTAAQPTATPAVTTTYILTVTNTATGCTDTDSVVVFVNPPPLAFTGLNQTICAGDSIMIGGPSIPGNTYTWSPATGLNATNVSNPYASPTVTTTYTLTETAGIGCSATNDITITVIPGAVADAGADITICTGASTVIGTPSIAGYTYIWTPVLGLGSTVIAKPSANPDSTTVYVLLVTNIATGCVSTDSVTVTVLPPPTANAGADQTICAGDSVLIGTPGMAGETYSWSPATGLSATNVAQPYAFPSTNTTYTLTVSNAGCSASDVVNVNVNTLPTASAGPDLSICAGETVAIGNPATAGNTYSWSPATGLDATNVAQPNATPDSTTTYILTVSNTVTGCSNADTITITVTPGPVAFAGADMTICEGDTVAIGTTATAGFTYSWSPATGLSAANVANPNAFPATTTTYIVTTTNASTLCSGTDTVTITVVAAPLAVAGSDQSICPGEDIILGAASVPGETYAWTPATGLSSTTISNPTASPDSTTVYVLTVTAGSCSSTDSVTITVLPNAGADAGADQSICVGSSTVIGTPAVTGTTYLWTPALGLSSATDAQPTASPAVTTTYIVTANNTTTGCSETDSVTVTVNPQPLATTGADQTICAGDSVTLGAAPVAGNTYSWSPATGLSATNVSNPNASPDVTTTYTLTESAGPGCVSTNTVTITVNETAVADAGIDQTICSGASVIIGTPIVTGMTYSWSPATGLDFTNVAQPNCSATVTTTYYVTVTNVSTGCQRIDSVIVNIGNAVTANAGTDQTICAGSSITIGAPAEPGITYSWSPATGLSTSTVAQPDASPATTTTYIVTADNGSGCTDSDTVTITVHELPLADAGADQTICSADTVSLGITPTPGYTYSWDNTASLNNGSASNPMAWPDVTTTYTLTVADGTCSATDQVTVTVNTLPEGLAGDDHLVCDGGEVTLGTGENSNYTYSWSPANNMNSSTSAQPTVLPFETTVYTLTVTDAASGCTVTDRVQVTVQSTGGFYTGISPNGDGINDEWTIPMLDCYSDNTVTILNRWGAEVWKTSNYNNQGVKWNGQNLDGEDLPDGTYYYVIAYNDTEKRGWVFIKR